MDTTQPPKKRTTSALLLLALLGAGLGGCAYGGIAQTTDGSILVARNSLFGGLRKIFVCKLNGTEMKCVETTNPP